MTEYRVCTHLAITGSAAIVAIVTIITTRVLPLNQFIDNVRLYALTVASVRSGCSVLIKYPPLTLFRGEFQIYLKVGENVLLLMRILVWHSDHTLIKI